MTAETKEFWIWNGWDHKGPRKVVGTPVPGHNRYAVLSESDGYHVTVVQYGTGGCTETKEQCFEYFLMQAKASVKSAEDRVNNIERMMERASQNPKDK